MEQLNSISPAIGVERQQVEGVSTRFRLGYRPALDGYRGVAILLVLLTHLDLVRNIYGFIGVQMFFVLSGFLITCLLLEEWDQNHAISLRAFYARRALRLLPALVGMLATFLLFSGLSHTPKEQATDFKEALITLCYSMNWAEAFNLFPPKYLAHTWSLSIEEQFYLLWPAMLLWMLRRNSRVSLFKYAVLGAALCWLARLIWLVRWWFLHPGIMADVRRLTCGLDTRADALLIGCAIGVAFASGLLPQSSRPRRWFLQPAAASVLGLWLIARFLLPQDPVMYVIGWSLMAVFAGILILELATDAGGGVHRFFTRSPLVYLGKISYGLYLWHFPVVVALHKLPVQPVYRGLIIVLISFAFTLASYYLIELPCLRWKRHFQKVR